MRIDVLTIFPDYLQPLRLSLVGKALEAGIVELGVHDLRDWTHDRHRSVDDTPYGGGAGMVMRPEPWGEALDALSAASPTARLIMLTPSGRTFNQRLARELAAEDHLIVGCGRYEGVDARVVRPPPPGWWVDLLSIGTTSQRRRGAPGIIRRSSGCCLALSAIASLTEESHSADHDPAAGAPAVHQAAEPAGWMCRRSCPAPSRSIAARRRSAHCPHSGPAGPASRR
jgi:tRNA (guanine37-N1)-methyltransferase